MKIVLKTTLGLALALMLPAIGSHAADQGAKAQVGKSAPAKATAAAKAAAGDKGTAAKPVAKGDTDKKADDAKNSSKSGGATKVVAAPIVGVGPHDWSQWCRSSLRNSVSDGKNIPVEWETGGFNSKTGEWLKDKSKNIKWVGRLGSQSYGNPTVANGRVYVGTNNGSGHLSHYPAAVDLGVLLSFDEANGDLLWQHSSEKLPSGRVNDWNLQGICCAPLVEGKRLWFVTSRGEVVCLDTEGFRDGENNGPYKDEKFTAEDEADSIWRFDMMKSLGIFQHNMCSCSVTSAGDILFVCTGNGVDEGHVNLPAPSAPSFIAMDKNTGKVLWTDNTPGANVLHGQWSSPAYAVLDGVPQVIFGGGDGWLYSFRGEATKNGKAELLWKFDCNPKETKYVPNGTSTRNHLIATPVIYDGLVYIGVGEDPEHLEGNGHLWCIDPTKRGDVSSELAFNVKDLKNPIPHRRLQAVIKEEGEVARDNPNSAAVWHYQGVDTNANGKMDFDEKMHRTLGTVAIKDDLLFVADYSGVLHCVDAKTGKPHWTHDMLACSWGSPLIVEGKVYVGNEDGAVAVFKLSDKKDLLAENNMGTSVYTSPIVANNVLYVADKDHLFAIQATDEADDKEDAK